jgi:hypothetical protein
MNRSPQNTDIDKKTATSKIPKVLLVHLVLFVRNVTAFTLARHTLELHLRCGRFFSLIFDGKLWLFLMFEY